MFGIGKMDPEKMQAMMEKLGIQTERIDAKEIVIKLKDGRTLKIRKPDIMKTHVMGRDVYQVSGDVKIAKIKKKRRQ
jgi:NACalpha-BTF3-like transcription factor